MIARRSMGKKTMAVKKENVLYDCQACSEMSQQIPSTWEHSLS